MPMFALFRQILVAVFVATALAPAQATPPPAGMLPVPPFPRPYQPTHIQIHDPVRLGDPLVIVNQDSPHARTINVATSASGSNVSVQLPPLAAGVYDVYYYDYPGFGYEDEPKLTMRFYVSAKGPVNVVEYLNAALGHYFITSELAEIEKLDRPGSGWSRTGESFRALPADEIPSFGRPVCRFYGLPTAGLDSHFFSASPEECARVADHWPDQWVLETLAAFGALVDIRPYTCEDTMQRHYRLYNNRPDANHRYTVSTAIRDAMMAKGWILEGSALDGDYEPNYTMCVLP